MEVGVIFPFFYTLFPFFFTHFSPFSYAFFSSSPKGQGQTTAIYCKNGEFHSDPVCTDPVQNFPTVRGTDGPVRGTKGPVTGTGPLLIARKPFFIAPVPVTVLIVGLRADL